MSYARFSEDSDIYLYKSMAYEDDKVWSLHVTAFTPNGVRSSYSPRSQDFTNIFYLIKVLENIRFEGFKIPQHALDRLYEEAKEYERLWKITFGLDGIIDRVEETYIPLPHFRAIKSFLSSDGTKKVIVTINAKTEAEAKIIAKDNFRSLVAELSLD